MAVSQKFKEMMDRNRDKRPVESGLYGFECIKAGWESRTLDNGKKAYMAKLIWRACRTDDGTRIEDAFEGIKREDGYEVPVNVLVGTPDFVRLFGGKDEQGNDLPGLCKWDKKELNKGGKFEGELWGELEFKAGKAKQKPDGTPILDDWKQPVVWPDVNVIKNSNGPLSGLGAREDFDSAISDEDFAAIEAAASAPVEMALDVNEAMAQVAPSGSPASVPHKGEPPKRKKGKAK